MSFITTAFNEIFFRPLLNILVCFTGILPFHDLGLAVIILTILVRLVLFPFTHHSLKSQIKMRSLEQERRTMALYKEHGINPFSGCVMLLVQLPLLIGLYRVFLVGVDEMGGYVYSFVSLPTSIHTLFLGVIDLMEVSIFLAILSGLTQFIQMKLSVPASSLGNQQKTDISNMMTTQMTYVMPMIIFVIGLQFAAAVSLYWTTMNIFAIIHEMIVRKKAEAIRVTYEHKPGKELKKV